MAGHTPVIQQEILEHSGQKPALLFQRQERVETSEVVARRNELGQVCGSTRVSAIRARRQGPLFFSQPNRRQAVDIQRHQSLGQRVGQLNGAIVNLLAADDE